MWEVTRQLFPEQMLSRVQVISSPFRILRVKSTFACGWKSEDGRLVADKVSLKKMGCLVAGLLEWIILHAWRVMRCSNLLGQSGIFDTHKQDRCK